MTDRMMQLAVGYVFGGILLVTMVQAFLPEGPLPSPVPVQTESCKGDPIVVDYPFQGGFLDPHACAVQCSDDKPRYVLYKNGQATQCETPPGCNDYGEDRGITCEPVAKTPAS